jgi:hypothetical protein
MFIVNAQTQCNGIIQQLQNHFPLSSDMSHLLAPDNHRNGQSHNKDIDASLCSERVNVTRLSHPWDDSVQEAKGYDVLSTKVSAASFNE